MRIDSTPTRWAALCVLLTTMAVFAGEDGPLLAETELLPIGASWSGKFTQRGTHPEVEFPPEVDACLSVTHSQGEVIELELRESMPGLDLTFLCKGRVIRNADGSLTLEFRSHGVKGMPKAGFYLLDVPYTARVTGNTIKGTWKFTDRAEGIDVGGDFSLVRE